MQHLNENIIQAFLDGELSDKLLAETTSHLSVCDVCANQLLLAEAEMTEISLAFQTENSAPIPTQRIWARIENEIDALTWQPKAAKETEKTFWQTFTEIFAPAYFAFAGGLAAVILVSLFSLKVLEQSVPNQIDVAANGLSSDSQNPELVSPPSISVLANSNFGDDIEEPKENVLQVVSAIYKAKPIVKKVKKGRSQVLPAAISRRAEFYVAAPLTEEKNYLNSITQLEQAVATNNEFLLSPSFRVEYERNVAVVDQAITAMQKQARRNPKDENAKRILFASYQNKIELLNTVSEKSQLIASLR